MITQPRFTNLGTPESQIQELRAALVDVVKQANLEISMLKKKIYEEGKNNGN